MRPQGSALRIFSLSLPGLSASRVRLGLSVLYCDDRTTSHSKVLLLMRCTQILARLYRSRPSPVLSCRAQTLVPTFQAMPLEDYDDDAEVILDDDDDDVAPTAHPTNNVFSKFAFRGVPAAAPAPLPLAAAPTRFKGIGGIQGMSHRLAIVPIPRASDTSGSLPFPPNATGRPPMPVKRPEGDDDCSPLKPVPRSTAAGAAAAGRRAVILEDDEEEEGGGTVRPRGDPPGPHGPPRLSDEEDDVVIVSAEDDGAAARAAVPPGFVRKAGALARLEAGRGGGEVWGSQYVRQASWPVLARISLPAASDQVSVCSALSRHDAADAGGAAADHGGCRSPAPIAAPRSRPARGSSHVSAAAAITPTVRRRNGRRRRRRGSGAVGGTLAGPAGKQGVRWLEIYDRG